jgi:hypothetical protein|tara:strand:+ start:319 stop:492 length:174 start_codon:yes stop_codon:yes gene_type:complete
MVTNKRAKNTTKIDEDLLERVKKLIKMKNKKIRYDNTKQFINVAVLNLLEKEEGKNG